MKNIFVAAIVLCLISATSALGQDLPSSRIGYVSSQRISAESVDGRAGVARVQALQQQKSAEVRAKQQVLEATRLKLVQATEGAERLPLQLQEQQQRQDLERTITQGQSDIQSLQRQVNAEILAKVKEILDDVLKGRDIQLVLNVETAIVWAAPGLDLTPLVLERLNAKPAGN